MSGGGRRPSLLWVHDDGREIAVWEDLKVRNFPKRPYDEWPVLYRRDVPNLTDEQWYAAPVESGWRLVVDRRKTSAAAGADEGQ